MRIIVITYLTLTVVALTACGAGDSAPALREVRPTSVAPGALILLSGERLDRVATITVGGVPASDLTVINAGLLTAVTPPGLAPGPQPLELRATDGRTLFGAVTVAALPASPQRAPQPQAAPQPTATPQPSPPTPSPPSVTPSPPRTPTVPPTRGRDDDDEQDKKPDNGRPPGRGRGR